MWTSKKPQQLHKITHFPPDIVISEKLDFSIPLMTPRDAGQKFKVFQMEAMLAWEGGRDMLGHKKGGGHIFLKNPTKVITLVHDQITVKK